MFFYYDTHLIYKSGDTFEKTYSFMHEPKKNAFSQYFFTDSIFVSLPLYPSYEFGDTIKIYGTVSERTTEKGTLLTLQNPEIEKAANNNPVILITKFVRERIVESVITTLPRREGGLLLGIILGVRDKIDRDFNEHLTIAGVLHVVAASGQNVSIVASILLVSLGSIVKRRHAILFTSFGIMFYALLTGFDPPIVRASIMALIAFGAAALGRQNVSIVALLLTGWVMVIVEPGLITNISFQLSFLSTFGIVVIKPLIDTMLHLKLFSFLKEDLTTTFSAQISTIPLMLFAFGSYSLISLPVNLLILWTVPIIMVFGGIGALMSLVSPLLAKPFVLLAFPFLAYFTTVVELSGRITAAISIESLPYPLIFGYYLILFGIVLKLNRVRRRNI